MAPARPLFKTYSVQPVRQFADGTLSAAARVCETYARLHLISSVAFLFILASIARRPCSVSGISMGSLF